MSESLWAGYVPWWNPYINFGIPQHADMSGGFWNPVTWIIGGTFGYNIYTITLEALFYILVGSFGMFKLGEFWKWATITKLIASISYMGCGYFIGHLQHLNWISGAGFLPWCVLSYLLLIRKCNVHTLSFAALCFYFFISSSHPGLIIGAIYFFGILTIGDLINTSSQTSLLQATRKISIAILLLIGVVIVLSAGMIISYAEILPYITRESKPIINDIQLNSSSLFSFISFLFPAAITQNSAFFLSDISLRNSYIGIIPFLFLLSCFSNIKSKKNLWGFLAGSLFFILLSIPSPLQTFLYKTIPLLGYVRLPGEFRIFALFGLIIIASAWLDIVLKNPGKQESIQTGSKILLGIFLLVMILSLYQILANQKSILFIVSFPKDVTETRSILKLLADSLTLYDLLFLQSIIQILLLFIIKKSMRSATRSLLLFACIADIFFTSNINLPFTGYGTKSAKELQHLLNTSPKGIPPPPLYPIRLNQQATMGIDSILGSWSFYNKQPGNQKQANYPIQFKSESALFEKKTMHYLQQRAFLFFEPDSTITSQKNGTSASSISSLIAEIQLLKFSPGHVKATFQNTAPGSITLMYKKYPHWVCTVNGKEVKTQTSTVPFLNIKIDKPGRQFIEFRYSPLLLQTVSLICCLLFVILVLIVIIKQISWYNKMYNV